MKTKRHSGFKNVSMQDDYFDDIETIKAKREKPKKHSSEDDLFDEETPRRRFKKTTKKHVFDEDEY